MLSVANLHLRELATATVEFFGTLRSPTSSTHSTIGSPTEEIKSAFSSPASSPTRELLLFSPSLRHHANVVGLQNICSRNPPPSNCQRLPSMRREFDETKRELARTKLEVAKLQDRCKLLEKTLAETKELVRLREEELEKVRSRQDDGRRSSNPSVGGGGPPERRYNDDETDLDMFPEESRARLKTTEVFMTRTDNWSGAQVLQAIHDLNSEILQFSAAATELCTFSKNDAAPTKAVAQATQDTVARLGPNLVKILSGRDHSQDPILVQLALQGCISICVARALSVFCMGYPTKADNVLTQIYSHIYASEPQPTSSKWRALSHRYIHSIYPYLNDYSSNELAETMYRWSAEIFLVAGGQNEKGSLTSRDGLRARFEEQIRRITKTTCKLAQVTKEEIMSTCFEVVAIEHSDTFDPRRMCDSFSEYGASRGDIVTTTELGLQCRTRKSVSNGGSVDGGTETRVLLAPRVILNSVLDFVDPR
ncbi:hypothetical protein E1B28_011196 [Marasmius oreades]|uniref:Uncharacterized protein n=1 Tax=Marasmius oreades TaxID=181124 RepID=A0A9P7RTQ5_9AGAR|nr:uncharacterized protein E1B28_011196 [Marasmius oreades]KAG7089520.1 hypothetical protein E1B28_011196 [Marasmius oreades]